ncbi:ZNF502 [Cervus elaphus hippelaphus]|uniref:ZNF502 n=1 Tax=Cervus elaphus hippelaphus TaxID=46360 RepID=A0A212C9F2_CEREH|nr:ZNF502 [Cervus elaphus hippelaphus]
MASDYTQTPLYLMNSWMNKPAPEQDGTDIELPGVTSKRSREDEYQDSTFEEKHICENMKENPPREAPGPRFFREGFGAITFIHKEAPPEMISQEYHFERSLLLTSSLEARRLAREETAAFAGAARIVGVRLDRSAREELRAAWEPADARGRKSMAGGASRFAWSGRRVGGEESSGAQLDWCREEKAGKDSVSRR